MGFDDATTEGRGRNSPGVPSGPLALASGIPDDGFVALDPDHPLYATFAEGWAVQDTLSLEQHRAYWLVGLRLWPKNGRPGRGERQAYLAGVARRAGVPDREIAEVLAVSEESLSRRLGEPRRRELLRAEDCIVTTSDDPWLPRIYLSEHEDAPHPHASFPNLPPGALDHADGWGREVGALLEAAVQRHRARVGS